MIKRTLLLIGLSVLVLGACGKDETRQRAASSDQEETAASEENPLFPAPRPVAFKPRPFEPNPVLLRDLAPTYVKEIEKLAAEVVRMPSDESVLVKLLAKQLQFHARFPLHARMYEDERQNAGSEGMPVAELKARVEMVKYPELQALELIGQGKYGEAIIRFEAADKARGEGHHEVLTSMETRFFTALAEVGQGGMSDSKKHPFALGCEEDPDAVEFCYFDGLMYLNDAKTTVDIRSKLELLSKARERLNGVFRATDGMHLPSMFAKAEALIIGESYISAARAPDKETGRSGLLFQALNQAQIMGSMGDVYLAHAGIARCRGLEAKEEKDPAKKARLLKDQEKHRKLALELYPDGANVHAFDGIITTE